jgi:hypothetical protein
LDEQKMAVSRIAFAVAISVCAIGCRDAGQSALSPGHSQTAPEASIGTAKPASASELNNLIAEHGSVTFRSFNGKWIGMDGDTDVTFLPKGAVHMVEYGAGVGYYDGTYAIDSSGQVTLELPTFGSVWPPMILRKDEASLFLLPIDDPDGFVMGNRGGATFAPEDGPYWPFRPIDPADEEQVLQTLED